ncbi:hypothetical protein Hanom_Chr16g01481781 [Helianthus anomalus]
MFQFPKFHNQSVSVTNCLVLRLDGRVNSSPFQLINPVRFLPQRKTANPLT